MDWRVNETRRLLALLLSCRGVQFDNANLCTDECIRRARESVYFASRGLTKIQQAACLRSTIPVYQMLADQVRQDTNAAEAIDIDENAESQNRPPAERAPPATSARGSRSSFTEQAQPALYSITIEYVFKTYGPYALQVSAMFVEAWAAVAQSTYAVGRTTIAEIVRARSQGGSVVSPALHASLRNAVPAHVASAAPVVQALENIRQEGRMQNFILSRREERQELECALAVALNTPNMNAVDVQVHRDRLLRFLSTPAVPPVPIASAVTAVASNSSQPSDATDPTAAASARSVRQRRASPPRVVTPAISLSAQLEQLAQIFDIIQCGGDGACTFKVLRVIEWGLGHNRRALHNAVIEDEDDTHTRNRVVRWMEANRNEGIFSFGGRLQSVIDAAAADQPALTFEQYLGWMRDVETSGGDIEIATFASMYVTPSLSSLGVSHILQV